MRLSTLAVALSGVFMTVSTASLKPELYESALTDRAVPIDGISTTCGICIYQCMAYVFICAVACGPGELLGPIACANCLIAAGASQQCFQCVEKCEGKVLLENCSAATNQCTGAPTRSPPGLHIVPQGLCTIPGFAKTVDNHGGECKGETSACDISVAATRNCQASFKLVRPKTLRSRA